MLKSDSFQLRDGYNSRNGEVIRTSHKEKARCRAVDKTPNSGQGDKFRRNFTTNSNLTCRETVSLLLISTSSNLSSSIICILPEFMVSSLLQVDLDLPNLTNHSLGLSGIEKSAIPWNSSFPPFCQPVLDDLELVRSQLKR